MNMQQRAVALTAVLWLLCSACADDVAPTDTGMAGDTGAGSDTGTGGSDTGSSVDTGASADTGSGACAACGVARDCCGSACTNLQNDPHNCGACGVACGAGTFCTGGSCAAVPCMGTCAASETCCGTMCCGAGTICCDPQGPVSTAPTCVTPDSRGTCPVGCAPLCRCASPDTPIATPQGERPIASLRVGDLVYSVEGDAVVVVPVARTRRNAVTDHEVVRVTLDNGVTLAISGLHPTADGRSFAALRAGDVLDGVSIISVRVVPYTHPYTYDILPASTTGAYYAGGALIGSTLQD